MGNRHGEALGEERCMGILACASSGYLALSQGALPLVVPVTCTLDGGQLLLRAGRGLLGTVVGQPGVVAFHTSSTSLDGRTRYEVLVQGRAEVACGVRRARHAAPPSLELVADEASLALRVSVERVTGWQYVGRWRRPQVSATETAKKEAAL